MYVEAKNSIRTVCQFKNLQLNFKLKDSNYIKKLNDRNLSLLLNKEKKLKFG